MLIHINTKIANKQFKQINEIVDFINNQNYHGDNYQMRRQIQINANRYWISHFFPDKKDTKDELTYSHELLLALTTNIDTLMSK